MGSSASLLEGVREDQREAATKRFDQLVQEGKTEEEAIVELKKEFEGVPADTATVKVLMVLTSHGACDGKDTGWYLPELTHPYYKFKEAGYDMDIVSIKGGATTVAPSSLDMNDAQNKSFWEDPALKGLTENTKTLGSCNPADYKCIFYVGGFGTMFDFAFDEDVNKFGRTIYEAGGVVGAVCHGPIALANITLSNGDCIIKGKDVTGFTNDEEDAIGLWDILPEHPDSAGKSCEQVLGAKGGNFKKADAWGVQVCSVDRVVSGQNPMSAGATGEAVVAAIAAL